MPSQSTAADRGCRGAWAAAAQFLNSFIKKIVKEESPKKGNVGWGKKNGKKKYV